MKIVLSPAKSLDYKSKLPTNRATQPQFLETTIKLNKKLKRLKKKELGDLMNISSKLADLNYGRYKEFQEDHNKNNSRPSIYAFAGDVYTGFDAYSLPVEKLDRLQERLRILSGMYGILRPLDLVQPYRLEMGTSIGIDRKENLYQVWQKKITSYLNKELEDGELFINLASNEYFKAVDSTALKVPVITPVFKDFKNGELKFISFFGKKARGSMARFIIDTEAETIDDLKAFDYDGYKYSETHSENENELVFIR